MKKFQRLLEERNVPQSMSRKGNCLDNSVMKTFLAGLKWKCITAKKLKASTPSYKNYMNIFIITTMKEYL